MNIKPTTMDEYEELKPKRPYTDVHKLLCEFAEGDYDICEVIEFTQANAKSCYASFHSSIVRYRMANIDVSIRRGRVFLIKKRP